MPVNGTARSIASGIIGIRSVESLERRSLVVQRAADTLALRAALAEAVKLIQRRVSPKDSTPVMKIIQGALREDAGQRLHDLIMRDGATIEEVRTMLRPEPAKESATA